MALHTTCHLSQGAEVKFILRTEPSVQIYLKDPKAKTHTTLSVARTDLMVGCRLFLSDT